jgi:hypothetical protein
VLAVGAGVRFTDQASVCLTLVLVDAWALLRRGCACSGGGCEAGEFCLAGVERSAVLRVSFGQDGAVIVVGGGEEGKVGYSVLGRVAGGGSMIGSAVVAGSACCGGEAEVAVGPLEMGLEIFPGLGSFVTVAPLSAGDFETTCGGDDVVGNADTFGGSRWIVAGGGVRDAVVNLLP